MNPKVAQGPLGFRIIGAFKLATALLLFGLGIGLFRLMGHDVADVLRHWITLIKLDPHSHYVNSAVSWVSGIDRKHLQEIGFGTFFYAALYSTEGIGLLLQRKWAGYLTVVATGSLIPLEAYEVIHGISAVKVGVLAVNVAIVVYLIWKLRQERRADRAAAAAETASDQRRGSTPRRLRTKKSR